MTQRKGPSKTAKFYQTKKKNLKILKNLNYSGIGQGSQVARKRKKKTAASKFRRDFGTGAKTARKRREGNFENEKDFLKKKQIISI